MTSLLHATAVTRGWNRHLRRVSTEILLWRRKFSLCCCQDSNLQPFDHEPCTLPSELSAPLLKEYSRCQSVFCFYSLLLSLLQPMWMQVKQQQQKVFLSLQYLFAAFSISPESHLNNCKVWTSQEPEGWKHFFVLNHSFIEQRSSWQITRSYMMQTGRHRGDLKETIIIKLITLTDCQSSIKNVCGVKKKSVVTKVCLVLENGMFSHT